ncbi:MAG: helix-hairpin-helix domain-containing protein [Gemmataceae bacterium]
MDNAQIADRLRSHASELARGGDNLYRVRAFRQAALAVLALPEPVAAVAERGGLDRVPGIGRSLAKTIAKWTAGGSV